VLEAVSTVTAQLVVDLAEVMFPETLRLQGLGCAEHGLRRRSEAPPDTRPSEAYFSANDAAFTLLFLVEGARVRAVWKTGSTRASRSIWLHSRVPE
jgi:hypothetical protein